METKRLIITELSAEMAYELHAQSMDEATRRFVPDEVFETPQAAHEAIAYLLSCRQHENGPQVCAVTLKDHTLVGYVQVVPWQEEWEIGYHIGSAYTCHGYATEAVKAFLPVMMEQIGIQRIFGICRSDNTASLKVLERCGFIKQCEGPGTYQGETKRIFRYLYQL